MCLYYDKGATTKLRARLKANGGKLTLWKAYDVYDGILWSPIFASYCDVRPGTIVSTRARKAWGKDAEDCDTGPGMQINRGLHVYTSRRRLAAAGWAKRVAFVPVTCHLKDLVAADGDDEAVFMQVTLSKRNHTKALKSA